MAAWVLTGPRTGSVQQVPVPETLPGQVVVAVARVGLCGTDAEFYSGAMPYLHDGQASYPLRLGHEWCGHVAELGGDVDPTWLGAFVTGDTMLGCGVCAVCLTGKHHVCADRYEIGIRGGWPGALAELLVVPVNALRRLPTGLDPAAGALVEPCGSAVRAVRAGRVGPGDTVCVWGSGTIGLLAAQVALARGARVEVVGVRAAQLELALRLGVHAVHSPAGAPGGFSVVIDAATSPLAAARAVEQVEPSGTVVLVGLAETPSLVDTRRMVLRDVTVVGILAASAGLDEAIRLFAGSKIAAEPLVAAVVGLDHVREVLSGKFPAPANGAPKVQIDPRI